VFFLFFSSRRRHTRFDCDWSSDVCSSDLAPAAPLPDNVPQPLRGIIRRCLAKEPGERYANAGEIRSALEAVPVHAEAVRRKIGWRRLAAMSAGVLAMLVLTAAGYWLHRSAPAQSVAVSTSCRPASAVRTFGRHGGSDR